MWDVLLKLLPMILPLIIDLFEKGPAACRLWSSNFGKLARSLRAMEVAMLKGGASTAAPLDAGAVRVTADAFDVIAGVLKCCSANQKLCDSMFAAAKAGPETFARMAISMSQGVSA